MSSFSICGNLTLKYITNNQFVNKFKKSKTLWFVIFNEYAIMLGFRSKEEFESIKPLDKRKSLLVRINSSDNYLNETMNQVMSRYSSISTENIDISNVSVNLSRENSREFIMIRGDREISFTTESEEALYSWVKAIQEARIGKTKHFNKLASQKEVSEGCSIDSDSASIISGSMRKFSQGSVYSWNTESFDANTENEFKIILESVENEFIELLNSPKNVLNLSRLSRDELQFLWTSIQRQKDQERFLCSLNEKIQQIIEDNKEDSSINVLKKSGDLLRNEIVRLVNTKREDEQILSNLKMSLKQERANTKKLKLIIAEAFLRKLSYLSTYTEIKENVHIRNDESIFAEFQFVYQIVREEMRTISNLIEEERVFNPQLPCLFGSFEQYHIDKFGFKHLIAPTIKYTAYVTKALIEHLIEKDSSKIIHECLSRCEQPNLLSMKRPEWKRIFLTGFKNETRSELWWALIQRRLENKYQNIDPLMYYKSLCQAITNRNVLPIHAKQINLDLLRTLPMHVNFEKFSSSGIVSLQEVLLCYSLHNPEVGYCQGMNFIAAISLMYLSRPESFWFMVIIIERCLPSNFYDTHLIGVQAEQYVLNEIIADKLPVLYKHLKKNDIDISSITMTWFVSLFHDTLPFECLIRVWDLFLLDGDKVLFRIALSILKIAENDLLQQKETLMVWKTLKNIAKYNIYSDKLINMAYEGFDSFPNRLEIANRYDYYLKKIKERTAMTEDSQKNGYLNKWSQSSNQFIQVVYQCPFSDICWLVLRIDNLTHLGHLFDDDDRIDILEFKTAKEINSIARLEDGFILMGSPDGELILADPEENNIIWNYTQNAHTITDLTVIYVKKHNTNILDPKTTHLMESSGYEEILQLERCIISLSSGELLIIENIANKEGLEMISKIFLCHFPIKKIYNNNDKEQLYCLGGSEIFILDYISLSKILTISTNEQTVNRIESLCYQPVGDQLFHWYSNQDENTIRLIDEQNSAEKKFYMTTQDIDASFIKTNNSVNNVIITAMVLMRPIESVDYFLWIAYDICCILVYKIKIDSTEEDLKTHGSTKKLISDIRIVKHQLIKLSENEDRVIISSLKTSDQQTVLTVLNSKDGPKIRMWSFDVKADEFKFKEIEIMSSDAS